MTILFFAVLLRIVINPLSNVFQKRICSGSFCTDGQNPFFTNFLTYFILSVTIIPLVWSISWTNFPAAFWCYSVLAGIFGALGNGFLVKAVRSGELSVLGPINAYKPVIGIIFGIVLLFEIPGLFGILGVALIVGGSYFVIDSGLPSERFSRKLLKRPDLRYRIAAMFLAAIEAVFIKKIVLYSDPNTAFAVWCWGGTIFSLIFLPIQTKQENIVWKYEWQKARSKIFLYMGLVCSVGLMQWSTNYVFQKIPVGYALALFQLSVILSVFYGWFFFNESQIIRKLFASAVMVLGSVLILSGN
ncbi:MAG: DMT family transporter [Planctomycetaceae bacterium]|jgi:drug/metabolite transporter (DMT)-like permease|nr:DMT family transporter [Planctomycetaceae bacterium]